MRILFGFFIILLFWGLGVTLAHFTGNIVPGSVIGMLLLFLSLCLKIVKPGQIKAVAGFLTKNMSLFFVPAGVGIMVYFDVLKDGWPFIVVASVLSTWAVLIVVSLIQEKGGKNK